MGSEILILDDFLDDYDDFRSFCDNLDYTGQVNPVDSVMYPGINIDIPLYIKSEILYKLGQITGKKIDTELMFLRMTREGIDVPHSAHTDTTMGDAGLILFLNRPEHCKGGTSFVVHKETGLSENPTTEEGQRAWERDTNNRDAWEIMEMVEMASNRGFVFDTDMMHRAEPPSGFGDTNEDGRLVLVCFFRFQDDSTRH